MQAATSTRKAESKSVQTSVPTIPELRSPDLLIGLAIVALLPAAFWTTLLGLVAPFFGLKLTTTTLFAIAIMIAAFLSIIYSAVARQD